MKLTLEGLRSPEWAARGIHLPGYSVTETAEKTRKHPEWVHFGIGNIFRIFLGGICDRLLEEGKTEKGITCVETFDFEVVDRIYRPHDNLALAVTLYGDGTTDRRVLGSLCEAVAARKEDTAARARLREIFTDPGLRMVSFTITEKGYALRNAAGEWFDFIREDMENGPAAVNSAISLVVSLLMDRYHAGQLPLALVSMDNVSHNGEKLRSAVLEMAQAWLDRGMCPLDFIAYLQDESRITFPLTMIDKITPRPSESVREMLTGLGVEDMEIVVTEKKTYIAPFVNAEAPQYLVIEDRFPNGRPPFEAAGVYMCDRDTVNAAERMKVTVCLNPLHTALAPYGCVLGYTRFSDVMQDGEMQLLVRRVAEEGMKVVHDPGILSPRAFIEECIGVRFPNPYIPDTPQRIAVDTSQMVGIRFGETIREYVKRTGTAAELVGIPLAIAGWFRYLLGVDDAGQRFELSPDPMNGELQAALAGIVIGRPETCTGQLRPFLENEMLFGSNLYEVGIGDRIEAYFREEIAGPGAVRTTVRRVLGGEGKTDEK
ncbi:MAG: mannitol dehydrogenase family protein [Clostridia bacterium]|nr:mannitol dehydrogenase family protein [Clostridia bacterium]